MLFFRILYCLLRKLRCCNKESLAASARNRAYKCLHFRSAHRMLFIPFLGLNIDQVKSKLVLHNDPVNAFIIRLFCSPCSIFESSITHFGHEVQHHLFKCLRGQLHNFIQKFILQTSVNFLKGILKNIIRRLLIFFCTFPLAVRIRIQHSLKLLKFFIAHQIINIYDFRILS